jgi:hypothetical protein
MIAEQMLKIIVSLSAAVLGFTSCAMRKTPSRVRARLKTARFVTRSAKTRPTKLGLSSMGSTDAERAAFPISITQPQTRTPKSCGTILQAA